MTLGAGGSLENASVATYITGFAALGRRPRHQLDRVRPDGKLYLTQGSNSAGGEKDFNWGFRPEKLLNAAVLEVDHKRDFVPGGYDVRTEPISLTDDPITDLPEGDFNADGTYPGSYDPFAEGAILRSSPPASATPTNLVWHSNGQLYTPTNGTANGAKSPRQPEHAPG